jgi:2-oxoglutarate dehydrogenase E1 component
MRRTSGGGEPSTEESLERFGLNAAVVDEIRQRYEVDPGSVDPSWSEYFHSSSASSAEPTQEPRRHPDRASEPAGELALRPGIADKHARVLRLIHAHRARGHRVADVDPLGGRSAYFPELDPAHYGLGDDDLDDPCVAGDLPGGPVQTLRDILDRLQATYCGRVGAEFTHIQDPGRRMWLQRRMEDTRNETPLDASERMRILLDASERMRILEKLSAAQLFERFIHAKFIGQKRFSLEGAESLIPLLDTLVEEGPAEGVREFVLGMAHRGRLNVLSNILGKSLESIFGEFEDAPLLESPFGSGDVKYHKGFSSDRRTREGHRVHLSLTSNPSHLEAVNPVVEGRTRAKQVRAGDADGRSIVPVLLHGDAAFAGQASSPRRSTSAT